MTNKVIRLITVIHSTNKQQKKTYRDQVIIRRFFGLNLNVCLLKILDRPIFFSSSEINKNTSFQWWNFKTTTYLFS